MAILLNDNLDIAANKPVDNRYGPYATVALAISGIPSFKRHIGLTVGIGLTNTVDYWFKAGTGDTDLIEKVPTVTLTKADVGLGNVDNTSDANKPVSTATQTALNAKENTITAGTTSQYWRGDKSWQTLDKSSVGLTNVNNTSDASKPISTLTQTALDAKQATLVSGTTIKTVNGNSLLGAGDIAITGGGGSGNTNLSYTASATGGTVLSDTGSDASLPLVDTTNAGLMSPADKTKLNGIATNANNYTHPNHTGDVTSTGDGATAIGNNVVTNAKLAQIAANTIKGRATTGTGNVEDLTAAQVRTILNVADGATANAAATVTPQPLGTAAVGTATAYARADHVHALPTASAIGAQATLVSGTNIKSINGTSLLGSGDISIGSGGTQVNSDWAATTGVAQILNKPVNATTTVGGLMSSTDKQKLDNLGLEFTNLGVTNTNQITLQVNKQYYVTKTVNGDVNLGLPGTAVNGNAIIVRVFSPNSATGNVIVGTLGGTPDFQPIATLNPNKGTIKLIYSDGWSVEYFAKEQIDLSEIAASGATTGQVPKWNGTSWAPANDSGGGTQVNSDWNATTGVAQILNKPTEFNPSSHSHTPDQISSDYYGNGSLYEDIEYIDGQLGQLQIDVSNNRLVTPAIISSNATLTSGRWVHQRVQNLSASSLTITLPTSPTAGDRFIISSTGGVTAVTQPIIIRRRNWTTTGTGDQFTTLATITAVNQEYQFTTQASAQQGWYLDIVETHTHNSNEIIYPGGGTSFGQAVADQLIDENGLTVYQPRGDYATLVNGTVPATQLPSYVDDVVECATQGARPQVGQTPGPETGKIYVTLDDNRCWRWTGTTYIEISPSSGQISAIVGLQDALNGKQTTIFNQATIAATANNQTFLVANSYPNNNGADLRRTLTTITFSANVTSGTTIIRLPQWLNTGLGAWRGDQAFFKFQVPSGVTLQFQWHNGTVWVDLAKFNFTGSEYWSAYQATIETGTHVIWNRFSTLYGVRDLFSPRLGNVFLSESEVGPYLEPNNIYNLTTTQPSFYPINLNPGKLGDRIIVRHSGPGNLQFTQNSQTFTAYSGSRTGGAVDNPQIEFLCSLSGGALIWNDVTPNGVVRSVAGKTGNVTLAVGDITQSGATTGQVIKWDGTSWVPGDDNTAALYPDIEIFGTGDANGVYKAVPKGGGISSPLPIMYSKVGTNYYLYQDVSNTWLLWNAGSMVTAARNQSNFPWETSYNSTSTVITRLDQIYASPLSFQITSPITELIDARRLTEISVSNMAGTSNPSTFILPGFQGTANIFKGGAVTGDVVIINHTQSAQNTTMEVKIPVWTGSAYTGTLNTLLTINKTGRWIFRFSGGIWSILAVAQHTHPVGDLTQGGATTGQVIKWNGTSWAPGDDTGGSGGGMTWSSVPATATSTGTAGQMSYADNYLYVCVATNVWKRTILATW